ncbi:hypothetical protein HDA40_001867 [Hamadaea flava]|uniref:Permease prefix domain 1-containing protein n=1 Tax=Hamadaea flava TaxID=1742688 RepID=A0ABV8LSG6_9ACTN|nr:permease prefix domain 1-containing protein [Hamadaea flava]MCP2323360.1 hypothetical protein [Hamadaea flava]
MTTEISDDGPVERYLDAMFDRLTGTGPAGRRMLAEAESHLLAATAEGRSRGLDHESAERQAVERFGSADDLARRVPRAAGNPWTTLRRLTIGTWAVAGTAVAWYGLSGILTWLLGWPWIRLLIATDRFGTQPDMCDRRWFPSDPVVDCVGQYHGQLDMVPAGGDRFPYMSVAISGVVLMAVLIVVRRVTVVGTANWTPARTSLALAFAVSFGLTGAVLVFYGVIGLLTWAPDRALSYLTAGLFALVIGVVAAYRTRTPSYSGPRPT